MNSFEARNFTKTDNSLHFFVTVLYAGMVGSTSSQRKALSRVAS